MEQTKGEILAEKLLYKRENGFISLNSQMREKIAAFCEDYKDFLNFGKTERACVSIVKKEAEAQGFVDIKNKTRLSCGDKVYITNRDKGIMLVVMGSDLIENGMNIIGAHIDTPRIDIKPNPLYEKYGLALLKTHYYGGIKKYQWTAMPLSLHGVVICKDGTKKEVHIGENPKDPVFCITDLLPHLASEQMAKKLSAGVIGEALNAVIGSIPYDDEKVSEKIKLSVLELLYEKYGILEKDFMSAELSLVPAFNARDVGIDRGIVGSFGQDDRVCAYTAYKAIFDIKNPKKTAVCLLVDKEEVGSMGNTGMKSAFFENYVAELIALCGNGYNDMKIRRAFNKSACLSADVTACLDPTYASVSDSMNTAYINCGVAVSKYTGSRGKSGSSDASAEFTGRITKLFTDSGVIWQTSELGMVDAGGGGTIAQYVANLNIDTIDVGVPVLSMHSPYELTGKVDIYMAYEAYKAFLK